MEGINENMSGKNDKHEKMIDMSARSNMKIIVASEYEAEQNKKSFQKLNDDINSKILEYNKKLDFYIDESLKKIELSKKMSSNGICHFGKVCSNLGCFRGKKKRMALIGLTFLLVGMVIFFYINSIPSSDILPSPSNRSVKIVELPDIDVSSGQSVDVPPEITEDEIDITTLQCLTDLRRVIPTSEDEENDSNNLIYVSEEFSAKDPITGKEYTREQLSGLRLLIPYIEGDKEVYFLGQYNENFRWHDYCITNTYLSNGTLYGIYEYNFVDGKCSHCKSLYKSKTDGEWIYLDREYHGNDKFGASVRYSLQYNNPKSFEVSDAEVSDILYIDQFIEDVNAVMLTYYYGNMSGGEYNDDSGKAYEIIFDEKGFVKILYVAKFSGGKVNDNNAKEIVLDQSVSDYNYFYYNGPIKENARQNEVSGKNYVTQDQIDEIIRDIGFECNIELKWHQENGG